MRLAGRWMVLFLVDDLGLYDIGFYGNPQKEYNAWLDDIIATARWTSD